MTTLIHPKLSLVGAGPGHTELITLMGLKALKTANVVLYDALVNKEFLNYAPPHALKLYVGKRKNRHAYTQEQINALIVDMAFTHGHVVRLKGGDPFVFGRGQEEVDYADAFNIETVVVPGISSSIGIPALNGIPVTSRGTSDSFWVLTGTTQQNALSDNIRVAAKTNATVVILMGLSKLLEITQVFLQENKGHTPVAIIQNGSLPTQKVVTGTIGTIAEISQKAEIQAPAIIIIGEVVKHYHTFNHNSAVANYLFN